ncbi:tRNA uracil 4-sulfurtransferase ThiI [Mycoplasma sp. Mirounga ES2805-ORL]|uniref:tRNA uracil 4-sulfurtransferase ThiI n=1 Tax=Mycoplasma sp. Mirounga ES2805-ORL TaxID=754514 RepID=UPI00197B2ED8|nr:tRNA uracil 4-sulfurtransferase ThiI [Mycoplasma sp. Mirounga ES2805-ORL]QSF13598.1 tRNA 4-thiouridine(8) synthase ThiI [Mycoplasma sp. Mirounga ES2805-ORL]
MYSKILIRYGELTLKGKNKMTFVKILSKNIKKIVGEKPEIEYDRMFLSYSEDNLSKLSKIFGITSYSPVIVTSRDFDVIKESSLQLVSPNIKTFKIAARRNDKSYSMKSSDINMKIGSYVLENFKSIKVDVHNPDVCINIEVRKNNTYIFSDIIQGIGGLPVGSSGEVLHLMSGGIDSPVAAYQLMKRGLKVTFLSFVTPPQTDQKTIDKMISLSKLLNEYQGDTKFLIGNYSKLLNYIALVSNPKYKITLMRRSFYRIASMLASKLKINILSNGENLGQVASQTIESMSVINAASTKLVLRPLLTNDKVETIELAKKIGTYDISIIKASETCELFAPKEPVTKPKLSDLVKLEEELNLLDKLEKELIDKNIETTFI